MEDANTTARLPLRKLLQRDAIANQLKEIDEDPEPDLRKKWPKYERLSDLHRKFREAGTSRWPTLSFEIACSAIGLVAIVGVGVYFATRPPDRWRVLDRVSDFTQTFQQFHNGRAMPPAVIHWCRDSPQPFEAGQTLTDFGFEYQSEGWCAINTKFSLLRDEQHCPIVPRNCKHTNCFDPDDHIVCEGKPAFE